MSRSSPWLARALLELTIVLLWKGLISPCAFFCFYQHWLCHVTPRPSILSNTAPFLHSQFQIWLFSVTAHHMQMLSPFDLLPFQVVYEHYTTQISAQTFEELYWQPVSFIPALYSSSLTYDIFPLMPKQPVLEELLMRACRMCLGNPCALYQAVSPFSTCLSVHSKSSDECLKHFFPLYIHDY